MTVSTEKMTQQCPERLRVFVVGHDTAFLDPIGKECFQRNYEVAIFHAISFPWNILKEAKDCVDIIIIDAQMQDPNSYGFVEYVKQLNEFPLCMMSDDVSEDAMSMAFENGADAIWGKPFGEKHIGQMRSEILRKKAEIKKITSNVKEVHKKKRGRDNDNYQQNKKFEWTTERRELFEKVVNQLGLDKAKPKKIVELMNVPGLTPTIVSSYLQRYKIKMSKLNEGREVDDSMSEDSNDNQDTNTCVKKNQDTTNTFVKKNQDTTICGKKNQDTNTAGVSVEVAPPPILFFNLSKSAEPQLGLKVAHPIPEDHLNVTLDSVNQCDNNPKDTAVRVCNVPLEYSNLLPSSSQSLQPTLEAVHSNQEEDLNVQQCDNNVYAKHNDDQDANTVGRVSEELLLSLSLSPSPQLSHEVDQNNVSSDSVIQHDNNNHASLANEFFYNYHVVYDYPLDELMSNQPNLFKELFI